MEEKLNSNLIDICYKKYNKVLDISWSELAQEFGYVSSEALRSKFKKYRAANGNLQAQEAIQDIVDAYVPDVQTNNSPQYKSSTEVKNDGSQTSDRLIAMSDKESKDVNFILKSHGYDSQSWELTSAKNSIWNVNTKLDGIKTLYSSKIAVKPKTAYSWNEEDAKKVFAGLKTDIQNKINIKPLQYKQNGRLLVLPIADFHLNLLSDKLSTGNEYNMEIAEELFFHVVNDVIDRVGNKSFEKVLFITGNDFINADNLNGTTTHGTPQDNSSSWFKAVQKATELIIKATDMLTKIAPVDVVFVPSNHDLHTMFGIMQTVEAWYKDDKNVSIDTSPLPRKYYKFGEMLIALSHDMKVKDALQIITTEAKSMWSECKHIVLLLAHLHQSMIYEKQGYLEVLRLPTISGFSRWSNDKGYVQTEKKNQSFVVDSKLGITDIINTVLELG